MIINKFTYLELKKVEDLLPKDWEVNFHFIVNNNSNIDNIDNNVKSILNVGNKFTIRIENYIINQPPNFSLSENWNNGTVPPEEILDVEVIQTIGKMTRVKAIGKCTRIPWEGWLPNKSFKIQ